MRKLFLSDEILMSVEKSARYIGNEVNSVMKDPNAVSLRFCMCFPDVYEVGMSHLGIQILYEMMNRREDVYCERVYSPWPDLHKIMKERNLPLFSLETQDPIKEFDMIGITLQYEMCYTNILQVLDLAQIPLSIFKDKELVKMVTLTGADRDWQDVEVMFENCAMTFFLRMYFAQDGMEIEDIKISLAKSKEEEIRLMFARMGE